MTEKILIVEDEKNIRNFVSAILGAQGYATLQAETGGMALTMAASHMPDIVLLDLGLPDMDGMEVLRRLREWSEIPVIILSARQNEAEKVEALDGGANDYVTKPFGNDELLARIRTALRLRRQIDNKRGKHVFRSGNLFIDYEKHIVKVSGTSVHLTPIEYKIMVLLSQNAGKVLTHDFIMKSLWGDQATDAQLVRVNVANIRRKIENNPADPEHILTEMGVGYRMAERSNM